MSGGVEEDAGVVVRLQQRIGQTALGEEPSARNALHSILHISLPLFDEFNHEPRLSKTHEISLLDPGNNATLMCV